MIKSSLKCIQIYTGDKNHSSTRNYELNPVELNPVGLVLWEELLEDVILHITPLCSLLHTLLKNKCMCFQDE